MISDSEEREFPSRNVVSPQNELRLLLALNISSETRISDSDSDFDEQMPRSPALLFVLRIRL